MNAFDYSRVIIALMCIGAAEQSLDETIAYVNSARPSVARWRNSRGFFPIAEHATCWKQLVGSVTVPLVARSGATARQRGGDGEVVGAKACGGRHP